MLSTEEKILFIVLQNRGSSDCGLRIADCGFIDSENPAFIVPPPARDISQLSICNLQSAIRNLQSAIRNQKILNLRSSPYGAMIRKAPGATSKRIGKVPITSPSSWTSALSFEFASASRAGW
jgi:hypothetical protein